MARALSQEEVLDFLCRAGGRVSNAALLGHFRCFLRDPSAAPELQQRRRDCFKRYVNSVAVVRQEAQPGGDAPAKYVVLRARYRDLLGEEEAVLPPSGAGERPESPQPALEDRGNPSSQIRPGRAEELPRTFLAAYWSQDSPSHACLEGHLRPGTAQEQRRQWGHHQPMGTPVPADSHWQGRRGSTPGLLLCPPPSGATYPPCPPSSGQVYPSCYPSSWGTSPPGPSSSSGASPPGPSSLRGTSPPGPSGRPSSRGTSPPDCPSSRGTSPPDHHSSRGILLPGCPSSRDTSPPRTSPPGPQSPRHISPLCPPPSGSTSPPGPPSSRDTMPVGPLFSSHIYPLCLPSSGGTSPPCPPYSGGTSALCPTSLGVVSPLCSASPVGTSPSPPLALDLYMPSRQDDWSPVSPPPYLSSPPALPGDNMESGWWGHLPVFKSIRCQLSLQDLEDFVDQATNESEESDSSSGSGSGAVDQHQEQTDVGPTTGRISTKCVEKTGANQWHDTLGSKLPDHQFKKNGAISRLTVYKKTARPTAPCEVNGTAPSISPRRTFDTDLRPTVLPLTCKTQLPGKSARLRDKMTSSSDELIDLYCREKSRRPSQLRKVSRMSIVTSSPDVDAPITLQPVGSKHLITDSGFTVQRQILRLGASSEVAELETRRSSSHRSSLVPLDPKEHDWVVKLASGSWMQVYGLLTEDPHLALRRDFISGYTALHWIAKHGNCRMFQNFVSGAEKAGIRLDMNVKSGGGYTPLHLAAIHGHEKVMKLLVEKLKVRVTVRDNSGKRAWQYLCSTTTGEVWQLLGAPRGKTIFPVCALSTTVSAAKSTKSRGALTNLSRKTSLAALLKPQHHKWKVSNQRNLHALKEVCSD